MATVLPNSTARTPVFPLMQNEASSNNGESLFCIEKILIDLTSSKVSTLRKEGDNLYINEVEYDISNFNILDLCKLLLKNKIKTSFINNNDYWYYPAICIRDFSNIEQRQQRLTCNPSNTLPFKEIRNLSIEPYSSPIFTVINVVSRITLQKHEYEQKNNLLFTKNYSNQCDLIYKVEVKTFSLKLDKKFSSNKEETVSRYLDENNDIY